MLALFLAFLFAAPSGVLPPLEKPVAVLLFVRTDCPISNRYAPEIQRIARRFEHQGVVFWLVYPQTGATEESIERHRREYGYTIPGIADTKHLYVKKAGVGVTPEAAVFLQGRLVYRGRIDNQYVTFGQARPEPTVHDLEDALVAVTAGHTPRESHSTAVGCAIEPLR